MTLHFPILFSLFLFYFHFQQPIFCCMLLTVVHGETWFREYPMLRDLESLKRHHAVMFNFQESTGK